MFRNTLIAAAVAVAYSGLAGAAVTADEAKQLGTTLTPIGAEKAANKDGTIPEWTGGLTTPPAGFVKGSGFRPDPFAADKPRLTIDAKNLAQHADKLTLGTQEIIKRNPGTYRLDVYPTRRPVTYPKRLLDNAAKNALTAKTANNGLSVENAIPGVPFPIPKTGYEVMWNHLVRYAGQTYCPKYDAWNVDSAGVATLATTGESWQEYPIYQGNKNEPFKGSDIYYQIRINYLAPARRNGEALIVKDAVDPLTNPRRAWTYLPGQRRVKAAPDVAYDTPNPGTAGATTYDDAFMFNGAMDRYDFKLIGKKEMYVPYNSYKLYYQPGSQANAMKAKHLNPDLERWELHRVWVVEATLKEGKRHIYAKRVIYLDEDSWLGVATDQYDARGQLFVSQYMPSPFSYDALAPTTSLQIYYNFIAGTYGTQGMCGLHKGLFYIEPLPERDWSPDSMAGAGVR
jgi:Protein of unknown function (DUF1329)